MSCRECECACKAAENGHYDCLVHTSVGKMFCEDHCEETVCECAAIHKDVKCLQYAHENGYLWGYDTAETAANAGSLNCLKYAHENGCGWDRDTPYWAAKGGHLDCLKYAHENKCEWRDIAYYYTTSTDCFDYLLDNDCPCDPSEVVCHYALVGELEMLKHACNRGMKPNIYAYYVAAEKGNVECLSYLFSLEYVGDPHITLAAASSGSLECLKLAVEKNYPIDSDCCCEAAEEGHFDCLMYLREIGATWSGDIAYDAKRNGHYDCALYAAFCYREDRRVKGKRAEISKKLLKLMSSSVYFKYVPLYSLTPTYFRVIPRDICRLIQKYM